MFRSRKEDQERFKTYYERKRNRKYSLFGAAREGFSFGVTMLLGMVLPVTLTILYADKLGIWWWIILLIYSTVLAMAIYVIYRYREITEIRGYFSKEEFAKEFKKELWLVRFMDHARRFLVH